ncbi:MAG: hypothetical protein HOP02_17070 [Methylococcaceae bacterium]|nr:hypothetical protein [Methylococcaceae bacterium]
MKTTKFNTIFMLGVLVATSFAQAEEAEFNPANSQLIIPQVKVGTAHVYNAKLLFDGTDNFKLQSFDTVPPANDTVPPTGAAALEQWLAKGSYKSWHCEASVHAGATGSPHGTVRICTNPTLATAKAAPYPAGSAGVKELYTDGKLSGFSVYVKTKEGEGKGNWYWYQKGMADSIDAEACEGCHAKAIDRVFVRVNQ